MFLVVNCRMGRFGAPKCRWTNSVIALCVSLTGLVLLGIGACMALFFANEELALAFGIVLVTVGFLLLVGGSGYYGTKYMCNNQFKHFARRHGWGEPVVITVFLYSSFLRQLTAFEGHII
jgi:hypothetical protein